MQSVAEQRFEALAATPLSRTGTGGGATKPFRQVREILSHRQMLGLLVRRDLKSRYKDSVLGFVWTLIRPITQLVIYYVALGKFLGAERGIPDFAIYIFCGLTVYGLFSEIVSAGTASVVGNAGLVKKIYLPREVFPIASVGAALFNFAIQLVVLLTATLVLGKFPLTPDLLYAIPAFVVIVVWGTALALLLSALNVYLRDVQYLIEVVLLVLMWASPIVYLWTYVQRALVTHTWLLDVYSANPVTLAVLGFQKAFWLGGQTVDSSPDNLLISLLLAILVGIAAVFGAQLVFARMQGNFAQAL